MPRIYQKHCKTAFFENVIKRNPVDSCRLHSHALPPKTPKPVRHPIEIRCEALEPPYGICIAVRADSNIMCTVSHIDPRCIRVHYLEPGSSERNLRASSFLSLRFACNLLSVDIPILLRETRDGIRPGDERFRNLPNGVEGLTIAVPATMPVIASTGAMLTFGHTAPMKVSAIACRIGSRIRVAKAD